MSSRRALARATLLLQQASSQQCSATACSLPLPQLHKVPGGAWGSIWAHHPAAAPAAPSAGACGTPTLLPCSPAALHTSARSKAEASNRDQDGSSSSSPGASTHEPATPSTSTSASAQQGSWITRQLPAGALPYAQLMRLDKPIGTWLLLWPCLWSIALAAPPGALPDPWVAGLFSVGAVLLRGAGCTINDLWDRDIDAKVERTRSRPLARGAVSPLQALTFLGGQLSLGLLILLQLNTFTQLLGASSLLLVGSYPLMKRVTNWPQAFLGLTLNWGALMGYAAVTGACDWRVVLPLYAAGVNWTLVYDTIYAHQDKRDDAAVGVKSTALHFGADTKRWLSGFAAAQAASLAVCGAAAGCGAPFLAAVAAGAGHQAWQVASVDLDDGRDCMAKFVSNQWYGAIIFAGIVADGLLRAPGGGGLL